MRTRLLVFAMALVAGVWLAPRHGSAGACASGEPVTPRLAPIPSVVASDGGLVVRAMRQLAETGDPAFRVGPQGRIGMQSGHFRLADGQVGARVVALASGLARVSPEAPIEGRVLWVTDHGSTSVTFAARPATLTRAPTLRSASMRVTRTRPNGEDTDVHRVVRVMLGEPPPVDARALLLFTRGEPVATLETALVPGGGRRIEVARGGSCDPFGWPYTWPLAHAAVTAAYMDDSGRLSPMSRATRLR